jgi:acyl dehydratase
MITQTMVQPSFWIEVGIQIQKVRGLNPFKFNDDLQARLEELIARQKANLLTTEETSELAGITELDRIFTLMNARIIAES